MIAANGVDRAIPRSAKGLPSIRRVLRVPRAMGSHRRAGGDVRRARCPTRPTPLALDAFLRERRRAPTRCVSRICRCRSSSCSAPASTRVEMPGRAAPGHFGLAVTRLHALDRAEPPLPRSRHAAAAEGGARRQRRRRTTARARGAGAHCTEQEDNAAKVERQVREVGGGAASCSRASASGSTPSSPARRRRARGCASLGHAGRRPRRAGARGLDVGDRVRVKLVAHRRRSRLHRLRERS